MAVNYMYNIELPSDELFLSSSTNVVLISTIFQRSFQKFVEVYHKKEVPLNFVEFYFNEIKNYNYMFRKTTREFFDSINQVSPTFELMAQVYNKSYYSQIAKIVTKNTDTFLILNDFNITDFIDEMASNSDKDTSSAVYNIKKITEHINSSDEIIEFSKIYENYMISKVIKQTEFLSPYKGKSKVFVNVYNNEDHPQIISATKHAERLVSERINISSKKGKVTKLIIPKLKLPSAYPKTTTFNRINSEFRVNNFISASRQILILNDLKVNGVAYSTNFVEKRKAANEES